MKNLFKDVDFSTWFIVIGLFILYFCTRNTMGLMENDNTMILSTVPTSQLVSQMNRTSSDEPQPTASEISTQQCDSFSTQDINDTTTQLIKNINKLQQRIKDDQDSLNSIQNMTNSLSNSISESQSQTDTESTQNMTESTKQISNSINQLISRIQGDMGELNSIQTMLGTLTESTKQATDVAVPKKLSDADKEYIKQQSKIIQDKRKFNYKTLKEDIENDVYCQTAAYYANKAGTYDNDPEWHTYFGVPKGVKCNPLPSYGTYPDSVNTISSDPSVPVSTS